MTEKKLKCGDVREDGMIFWVYDKSCKNGEWWVTPEKFSDKKAKKRARNATPEAKAKQRERRSTPEAKAKEREYQAKPEVRAKLRDRASKPKAKAWRREYEATPEAKALRREHQAKQKVRANKNNRRTLRRRTDPLFALKSRLVIRTATVFSRAGFKKNTRTAEMLGCTWEFLKAHIENQFTKGMSWENRILWHIDHIIPLASARTEAELIRLCHFSNLRPLWASENLIKNAKLVTCQPELALTHH